MKRNCLCNLEPTVNRRFSRVAHNLKDQSFPRCFQSALPTRCAYDPRATLLLLSLLRSVQCQSVATLRRLGRRPRPFRVLHIKQEDSFPLTHSLTRRRRRRWQRRRGRPRRSPHFLLLLLSRLNCRGAIGAALISAAAEGVDASLCSVWFGQCPGKGINKDN